MFMFFFKKNLPNVNKKTTFESLQSFQHQLTKSYPQSYPQYSQQIKITETNNTVIASGGFGVSTRYNTANTVPPANNPSTVSTNLDNSLLVGNIAGKPLLENDRLVDEVRTSTDDFAQKTRNEFARLGGELFATLKQSFVLFGLKTDDESLHVATDPFNTRTIYWYEEGNCVLVSTDIVFIKTMLGGELRLSERGLSSWLSGYPNPAISLFAEINVLPIGHRLKVPLSGASQIIKFWDIDPTHKVKLTSQSEYSAQFFDVLQSSVSAACASDKNIIASQMSGGLDSTSITALAKNVLASENKGVLPVSHLYKQAEKCDEETLVNDMLALLGTEHNIQMTVDEGEDRNFLNLYPTHLESPGTVLSPRYSKELALIKNAGADVLLTGNGGDEMCWGHSVAYTQRLRQGEWSVVKEVLSACSAMGMSKRRTISNLFIKPFVPELVLKILTGRPRNSDDQSVPIWMTDKARGLAVEETQVSNPFDKQKDPVGYNRYQSLKTTSTYNAMRSYEKVAQQFNIDVRHPFFNTQVAEFSFAVPDKQLIQGPYPKWLLRHSMQNHLPDSVCWNLHKTTFDQHFGNLVRENASELRQILQDTRLADMGLVNQTLLLAEFDRVVSNPDLPLQVDLLYAILTFSWLRSHYPG